jgi:hypothetical protein
VLYLVRVNSSRGPREAARLRQEWWLRMKIYDLRVALVALAAGFGLLALYVAYALAAEVPEAQAYAEYLSELPDARDARAGDTVAVAGTIAADAPLLRDEFVIFDRRQTQGAAFRGTEVVTIETGKQPFSITTPYGGVRVVNDDYRLDDRYTDWTDVERRDTPPGLTEGGITIQGLTREGRVLAVGVLEAEGGEKALLAESVVAGSKDAYIAELRQRSGRGSDAIMPVLGIGVLLLLYVVWDGRRLWREQR